PLHDALPICPKVISLSVHPDVMSPLLPHRIPALRFARFGVHYRGVLANGGIYAMGIIGADHTCYTVRDLDAARHFYCDILGFEIIHARPEITNRYFRDIVGFPDAVVRDLYLRIPGTNHRLELFEYQHPKGVQQDTTPNNPG